jgi:Zn-dependent oligopeptidase
MDNYARTIIEACSAIIARVKQEQAELLEIAEDHEKRDLRETVYDLEQAGSLLNRATHR